MDKNQFIEMLKDAILSKTGNDDDDEKMTPLFLMADHPDILSEFDNVHSGSDKLAAEALQIKKQAEQQLEFLAKQHANLHKRVWDSIETMMRDKGLAPPVSEKKLNLRVSNGVMYRVN